MSIIYLTTNLINFKYYVGFDYYNNPKYLGSGTAIIAAIKKYGKENFKKEILEEFVFDVDHPELDDISLGDWQDRERYWIDFYCSFKNRELGYNLTEGGGGVRGYHHTNEIKQNMSIAHIGLKDTQETIEIKILAQNRPEVKEKHRNNTKHLWQLPEYQEKQRIAQTGRKATEKQKNYKVKKLRHIGVGGRYILAKNLDLVLKKVKNMALIN
jgi:group I intron endonuclease